MKKRSLAPIPILAFALTGCTQTEPVSAPSSLTARAAEVPTVAPEAPPPPPPIDSHDPLVNTLRVELGRDPQALSRLEHYRPLCDKDGYPIVGNLMQKGPTLVEPSQLCAEVRKGKAR